MAGKSETLKDGSGVLGLFGLISFFQSSWLELKKVHSPTKPETVQATIVVIAMLVAVALFLGAVDMLLAYLMQLATS